MKMKLANCTACFKPSNKAKQSLPREESNQHPSSINSKEHNTSLESGKIKSKQVESQQSPPQGNSLDNSELLHKKEKKNKKIPKNLKDGSCSKNMSKKKNSTEENKNKIAKCDSSDILVEVESSRIRQNNDMGISQCSIELDPALQGAHLQVGDRKMGKIPLTKEMVNNFKHECPACQKYFAAIYVLKCCRRKICKPCYKKIHKFAASKCGQSDNLACPVCRSTEFSLEYIDYDGKDENEALSRILSSIQKPSPSMLDKDKCSSTKPSSTNMLLMNAYCNRETVTTTKTQATRTKNKSRNAESPDNTDDDITERNEADRENKQQYFIGDKSWEPNQTSFSRLSSRSELNISQTAEAKTERIGYRPKPMHLKNRSLHNYSIQDRIQCAIEKTKTFPRCSLVNKHIGKMEKSDDESDNLLSERTKKFGSEEDDVVRPYHFATPKTIKTNANHLNPMLNETLNRSSTLKPIYSVNEDGTFSQDEIFSPLFHNQALSPVSPGFSLNMFKFGKSPTNSHADNTQLSPLSVGVIGHPSHVQSSSRTINETENSNVSSIHRINEISQTLSPMMSAQAPGQRTTTSVANPLLRHVLSAGQFSHAVGHKEPEGNDEIQWPTPSFKPKEATTTVPVVQASNYLQSLVGVERVKPAPKGKKKSGFFEMSTLLSSDKNKLGIIQETPQLGSREIPMMGFQETPQLGSREIPMMGFQETPQLGAREIPRLALQQYI